MEVPLTNYTLKIGLVQYFNCELSSKMERGQMTVFCKVQLTTN